MTKRPARTILLDRTTWKLPDGRLHREDGPAVIYETGEWEYYQHHQPHRIDGPALKYFVAGRWVYYWRLNGIHYSFDQWLEKTPISDEDKTLLKLEYG